MIPHAHVAVRLPDGALVPAWNGAHARELNAREFGGWGQIIIELIVVELEPRRSSLVAS